jgi:hypothetical protein
MVKYNGNQKITNTYENFQIIQSLISLYSFIFGLIQISIGLSVFEFDANKHELNLHLTIHNIWSPIR